MQNISINTTRTTPVKKRLRSSRLAKKKVAGKNNDDDSIEIMPNEYERFWGVYADDKSIIKYEEKQREKHDAEDEKRYCKYEVNLC